MTTTALNYRLSNGEGQVTPGSMLCTITSTNLSGTARRLGPVIYDHHLDEFLAEAFADPEVQFVAVWDQASEGQDFHAQYKRVEPAELPLVLQAHVTVRSAGAIRADVERAHDDLRSGIAAVLDTLRRQYPGLRFESEVTR
jgi:hypothetical protein